MSRATALSRLALQLSPKLRILALLAPTPRFAMSQRTATSAKASASSAHVPTVPTVKGILANLWRFMPEPPAEPEDYKGWVHMFAQAVVSRELSICG